MVNCHKIRVKIRLILFKTPFSTRLIASPDLHTGDLYQEGLT